MKMILVTINKDDTRKVSDVLLHAGISYTLLATTGGFRGVGNTTLLIGAENAQVDDVIQLLRNTCDRNRKHSEGAVIFVADVDQFQKL